MNAELTEMPAPFEVLSSRRQFLILMGFFLICLVLFGLIGLVCILWIGHVSIYDVQGLSDYTNPEILLGLKVAQIVSSFGTFIIPAIVFALLASRHRAEYLQVNRLGKLSTMLLGGLLMWSALPLINYLAELNSHMQLPSFMHGVEVWMKDSEQKAEALTNAFMGHQTFGGFLVNLFMIGLLAAVAEEIFFRAVLQKIMIKMFKNIHWGIWITAFLFSFLHFEFYGFLPRMLMGVYLGYLFVWSKSLWVPIFAHFLNNGTAVLFSYLEERNIVPKTIDQVGTDNSQIIYVIASTIVVALIIFIIYRSENKGNETAVV
ncbi:MAG TPA: CPBP family intramembrane glutamic endopeptidase [Bacteroidia bacterium]|jgi:membrane protease YdiL (CAAX protease family)|nr:CPBP family intramembrane glutamic endopeptidase [Bacteroidia bacterium]